MNNKILVSAFFGVLLCGHAAAQTDVRTLQQQLQERDAIIRDLQQRVEALEKRSRDAVPAAVQAAPAAVPPAADRQARNAPPPAASVAATGRTEEDETARALERALVREGGFLLPPRAMEVEPRLQYTYRGTRGAGIVQTPAGALVADRSANRHRSEATLGFRVGLPWSSQAELRVPYVWMRNDTSALAAGVADAERREGLGDAELQLTKQLAVERGGRPALLASLTWKPATGSFDLTSPSPGSGFPSLQAALTAVKRQDPLVFIGSLSYTAFRSRSELGNQIDPGNALGVRLGTLLAASPETSLRTTLDLSRAAKTRLNGRSAPGTQALSGVVELGLSTLVAKNILLDVNVGFGITPDAPNLRLGVSLPIRFD
jgi:hypothetical protein